MYVCTAVLQSPRPLLQALPSPSASLSVDAMSMSAPLPTTLEGLLLESQRLYTKVVDTKIVLGTPVLGPKGGSVTSETLRGTLA